jgi:hypothetical protein
LVRSAKTLEEFIKTNKPKKEAYKDIKQQEKKGDFDWKKRNRENKDIGIKRDPIVKNAEYKRKIEELLIGKS